ncbi:MAG TPA: hypothetical protein VF517_14325 [Thermoleophilaceae bacterium]
MNLDAYRADAQAFWQELEREYLLHLSGRKEGFELEAIYAGHAGLFTREAVERLREDDAPRELVRFAVEGLLGQATKGEAEEVARVETAARVHANGDELGFREAVAVQANETDADRREAIDRARREVVERDLNPLLLEAHERAAALTRELGWESTLAMCEELGGIDLRALGRQAEAFVAATEEAYEPMVEPELRRQLGYGLDRLRRADLPAFFRARGFDDGFPGERLLESLERTAGGLGLDGARVQIDAERRPTKSPRAFCAPVRVPDEVHLVIAPVGGCDDYEALMHEAGHAYHYSHTDRRLPFEASCLGDNSVTEAYAFLLQHLTADAEWLAAMLGMADSEPVLRFARASRIVFLRRYCAKLGYELGLHADGRPPAEHRAEYSRRLGTALRVDWPGETWLADVDSFFYAARYLRAWAFETRLRLLFQERFGPRWFAEPEAGALLRSLWATGQARSADELLAELTGERLDLGVLATDLAVA